MGCWYDKVPTTESHDVCFENCVFDSEVGIAGLSNVVFHNCFFLDQVSIETIKEGCLIDFEHCAFKSGLYISKCEAERLSVNYCNIALGAVIIGCRIEKETVISDLNIGLFCRIEDSEFGGRGAFLSDIETKDELAICGCRFDAAASISLCRLGKLEVERSRFDSLTMDSIFANTYWEYESLSNEEKCKDSAHRPDVPENLEEEAGEDDGLTDREREFDRAIGNAIYRHGGSCIMFRETFFNGTVEIRKAVVSLLVIWKCRALDDFLMLEECEYDDYKNSK
jgi:hypothetical protein